MYNVVKKDGNIENFEIDKLIESIQKAFEREDCLHPNPAPTMIVLHVAADYEPKIKGGVVTTEQIRESVVKVLTNAGYRDEADAYIKNQKQKPYERIMYAKPFFKEYAM